jgi:pimeloyl-ACP methyl ester carboxylesterase
MKKSGDYRIGKWTIIIILGVLAFSSMSCAHELEVKGKSGDEIRLLVNEKRHVTINGAKQWIYIAGTSKDNPVLLWLDGGPGGSELGPVRNYLGDLHRHFTVVCWDQRGTGKTRASTRSLFAPKVETYVEDVIALSRYLIKEFGDKKIFLVGHSWGSIIGTMAAYRKPELFAAYIGVGQQVNSAENDGIGWEMVRSGAKKAGEEAVVRHLDSIGLPPYTKGNDYVYLFSRLYRYSPQAPMEGAFDSTWFFKARQHSLIDKIRVGIGLYEGVQKVYPQLADLDFERDYTLFRCPIYIVAGRYDLTCVSTIAARWYERIQAPTKGFEWFELSGHNACYEEVDRFVSGMENIAKLHKD